MISKLKRRFIVLAMSTLIVMMTVVVAGMNIINYNSVVSDADETLEMLSSNKGRFFMFIDDTIGKRLDEYGRIDGSTAPGTYDDIDAATSEGFGRRPRKMSRDEAEEIRYFTVLLDADQNVIMTNTERIYAVDETEAATMAAEVAAKSAASGFEGEYRYLMNTEGDFTRVTFLDCGRKLEAFRSYLYASLIMSFVGLAILFGVICYFAGRIVKPVAESYEKQKRFITDAGHEIKTPLTIIKANIDVMKMDIDDDLDESGENKELASSLNESLDDISGQVDRLTTLTNDLVYLSRMEEAGSLTLTEVPVSDIVSETAGSFGPVAIERSKELELDVAPMLSMQGSTKELEKLVSILVENALKYSPEGDKVKVSLRKESKNIVLEVRNHTNEPVTDEDLAHVFERFYRTDKSRNSAAGGHGIGLSMASAIVAAHGGKISARSGDGTEFIVTAAMPAAA